MEGDYHDERIIGRITKEQRKFEEAFDCYNGLISESIENNQEPDSEDIINLVEVNEELGGYDKALQLLDSYNLKEQNIRYFSELYEKKIIKDRLLHYYDMA